MKCISVLAFVLLTEYGICNRRTEYAEGWQKSEVQDEDTAEDASPHFRLFLQKDDLMPHSSDHLRVDRGFNEFRNFNEKYKRKARAIKQLSEVYNRVLKDAESLVHFTRSLKNKYFGRKRKITKTTPRDDSLMDIERSLGYTDDRLSETNTKISKIYNEERKYNYFRKNNRNQSNSSPAILEKRKRMYSGLSKMLKSINNKPRVQYTQPNDYVHPLYFSNNPVWNSNSTAKYPKVFNRVTKYFRPNFVSTKFPEDEANIKRMETRNAENVISIRNRPLRKFSLAKNTKSTPTDAKRLVHQFNSTTKFKFVDRRDTKFKDNSDISYAVLNRSSPRILPDDFQQTNKILSKRSLDSYYAGKSSEIRAGHVLKKSNISCRMEKIKNPDNLMMSPNIQRSEPKQLDFNERSQPISDIVSRKNEPDLLKFETSSFPGKLLNEYPSNNLFLDYESDPQYLPRKYKQKFYKKHNISQQTNTKWVPTMCPILATSRNLTINDKLFRKIPNTEDNSRLIIGPNNNKHFTQPLKDDITKLDPRKDKFFMLNFTPLLSENKKSKNKDYLENSYDSVDYDKDEDENTTSDSLDKHNFLVLSDDDEIIHKKSKRTSIKDFDVTTEFDQKSCNEMSDQQVMRCNCRSYSGKAPRKIVSNKKSIKHFPNDETSFCRHNIKSSVRKTVNAYTNSTRKPQSSVKVDRNKPSTLLMSTLKASYAFPNVSDDLYRDEDNTDGTNEEDDEDDDVLLPETSMATILTSKKKKYVTTALPGTTEMDTTVQPSTLSCEGSTYTTTSLKPQIKITEDLNYQKPTFKFREVLEFLNTRNCDSESTSTVQYKRPHISSFVSKLITKLSRRNKYSLSNSTERQKKIIKTRRNTSERTKLLRKYKFSTPIVKDQKKRSANLNRRNTQPDSTDYKKREINRNSADGTNNKMAKPVAHFSSERQNLNTESVLVVNDMYENNAESDDDEEDDLDEIEDEQTVVNDNMTSTVFTSLLAKMGVQRNAMRSQISQKSSTEKQNSTPTETDDDNEPTEYDDFFFDTSTVVNIYSPNPLLIQENATHISRLASIYSAIKESAKLREILSSVAPGSISQSGEGIDEILMNCTFGNSSDNVSRKKYLYGFSGKKVRTPDDSEATTNSNGDLSKVCKNVLDAIMKCVTAHLSLNMTTTEISITETSTVSEISSVTTTNASKTVKPKTGNISSSTTKEILETPSAEELVNSIMTLLTTDSAGVSNDTTKSLITSSSSSPSKNGTTKLTTIKTTPTNIPENISITSDLPTEAKTESNSSTQMASTSSTGESVTNKTDRIREKCTCTKPSRTKDTCVTPQSEKLSQAECDDEMPDTETYPTFDSDSIQDRLNRLKGICTMELDFMNSETRVPGEESHFLQAPIKSNFPKEEYRVQNCFLHRNTHPLPHDLILHQQERKAVPIFARKLERLLSTPSLIKCIPVAKFTEVIQNEQPNTLPTKIESGNNVAKLKISFGQNKTQLLKVST